MIAGPERSAISARLRQSARPRWGRRAGDGAVTAPSPAVERPRGGVWVASELSPWESLMGCYYSLAAASFTALTMPAASLLPASMSTTPEFSALPTFWPNVVSIQISTYGASL